MKMRSAAAAKILSVSEKRGGSGGGSLSPRTRRSPDVSPGDAGASVALIFRVVRGRLVVLSVLVLVGLRPEAGDVDGDRQRCIARRAHRDGNLHLGSLLVPGVDDVGPGRDAVEAECAVRAGHLG